MRIITTVKKDLIEAIAHIKDEEIIYFAYDDPDGEGDAEEGDILTLTGVGFKPQIGHLIYVAKK